MVQVDRETLKILKQNLKDKKDYAIISKKTQLKSDINHSPPGDENNKQPIDQLVEFVWTDDDRDINRGVRSPIDHFPLDGIKNCRIHYTLGGHNQSPMIVAGIRWTDLFFIDCENFMLRTQQQSLPHTMEKLANSLANSFIQGLTPFLDQLKDANCYKIGLRATIDRENASYLAGSNGEQLSQYFLSQLDDVLVPIIMQTSSEHSIVELIFYLID